MTTACPVRNGVSHGEAGGTVWARQWRGLLRGGLFLLSVRSHRRRFFRTIWSDAGIKWEWGALWLQVKDMRERPGMDAAGKL